MQEIDEVVQFFEDNNFPLQAMFKAGGSMGLTESLVLAGMQRVYERVQVGEKIKAIQLARQAFAEGKKIGADKYQDQMRKMIRVEERFRNIEDAISRLEINCWGMRFKRFMLGVTNYSKYGRSPINE